MNARAWLHFFPYGFGGSFSTRHRKPPSETGEIERGIKVGWARS